MASRVFRFLPGPADWAGSTKRPDDHLSVLFKPRSTRISSLPNGRPRTIPRRGPLSTARAHTYVGQPHLARSSGRGTSGIHARIPRGGRTHFAGRAVPQSAERIWAEPIEPGNHQPARIRAEHLVLKILVVRYFPPNITVIPDLIRDPGFCRVMGPGSRFAWPGRQ